MKPQTDIYHLNEASTSGKYGFECFQKEDDGSFYFHFNNEAGKAIFYSQSYKSARSRENAINSVITNAPKAERYEVSEGPDNFYFVLKAGNFQAIGQSPVFETKKEMETAKKLIMAMDNPPAFEREEKTSAIEDQQFSQKTAAHGNGQTAQNPPDAPRQSYFVKVYPGEPLSVQITHVLTQSQKTFNTLSGDAIAEFINSFLPEEWKTNPEIAATGKSAAMAPIGLQSKAVETGANRQREQASEESTEVQDLPNPAQAIMEKQPSLDNVISNFMREEKTAVSSKEFSPRQVRELLRNATPEPIPVTVENEVDSFIKSGKPHPLVEASRVTLGDDVVMDLLQSKKDLGEFVVGKQKKVSFNTDFLKGKKEQPAPKVSTIEEFINGKGATVLIETFKEEDMKVSFSEVLSSSAKSSGDKSKNDAVENFMKSPNCACKV